MAWYSRLFQGRRSKDADYAIRELKDQFYVTLEAHFAKVTNGSSTPRNDAYARVERMLGPDTFRNWTNAYAIEQILIQLFDDDTVATEFQIRTLEAADVLRPAQATHYKTEAAKPQITAAARRVLLARLVDDLQWRYTVNDVKRRFSTWITATTGNLFIASLVLFAGAILITIWFPGLKKDNLLLLVPAILAGCWGASFSMLSSVKDRIAASELDDLKVLRQVSVLGSRVLIGAGAASILFFFLVSGLVSGTVFPDLAKRGTPNQTTASAKEKSGAEVPGSSGTPAPRTPGEEDPSKAKNKPDDWLKNLSLLVVWCFIAGFSERLIPGLIARTEGSLADNPPSQERGRPPVGSPPAPPPSPPLQDGKKPPSNAGATKDGDAQGGDKDTETES